MEELTKKYRFKDEETYKQTLNMAPDGAYIKSRELGGGRKSKYLPLFEQQAIADFFFDNWNIIQEDSKLVINEIVVTVKLQYQPSYPGADIFVATGSASKAVQASKGSDVALFPKGKLTNSLEYCLPAARAAAISNALTSLGNIFGRNLNRDTKNNYSKQAKQNKDE